MKIECSACGKPMEPTPELIALAVETFGLRWLDVWPICKDCISKIEKVTK